MATMRAMVAAASVVGNKEGEGSDGGMGEGCSNEGGGRQRGR